MLYQQSLPVQQLHLLVVFLDHTCVICLRGLDLGFLWNGVFFLLRVLLSFLFLFLIIHSCSSINLNFVFSQVEGVIQIEVGRARKAVINLIFLRLFLQLIQQTEDGPKTVIMQQEKVREDKFLGE